MAWTKFRTIVEEIIVEDAVNSFSTTFPRFREAWDGVKWFLARCDEDIGVMKKMEHGQYRLYIVAGDPIAETPEMWVTFEMSDEEVVIHGVHAVVSETAQ